MRLFLLGSRDLKGISEIVEGIVILHIRYGQRLVSSSHGGRLILKLLQKLYRKALRNSPNVLSCVVVVEAEVELQDLGLIHAVIGLWDIVTKKSGRIVLVGYPSITASGRRTFTPPMLPNFGLARDLTSALKWVRRPKFEIEGGDQWFNYPGVSRARSLLAGERFLEEDSEPE